jgi:hypothetical protein
VDDLVAEALALPATPLVRRDGGERDTAPAARSAAEERPWLLSAGIAEGGPDAATIANFLTVAGLVVRERRDIAERAGPVLVVRTEAAPAARIECIGAALRTVGAVRDWTAFRVLERSCAADPS